MDEGTLGVHEIELVIQPGPGLGNGSGVAEHADGSWDLGQVASGHNGGRVIVDSNFEASWAPVDKLD